MKCCDHCFNDLLISKIIIDNQELGSCNFCKSEEVFIIDTDELTEYFDNLYKHYDSTEPYEYFHPEIHEDPSEFGDRLINLVNEDWDIFSELIEGTGIDESLLFDILNTNKDNDPNDYIDPNNLYSRITDSFYFVNPVEEWEDVWKRFKKELKHSNRFFPQLQDFVFDEYFDSVLRYRTLNLPKNDSIYRARLGTQEKDQMLNPPPENAKSGRANPNGISYLYCAINEDTCIAEIRPWKGAKVTVAEIGLKRELKLVNLVWENICPFLFDIPETALKIDGLLRHFSEELSKPVDPHKSEIDYLPTQYITELIKSKGYDGICFQSSLGSGWNFVLFDSEYAEVIDVRYFQVNKISYEYI